MAGITNLIEEIRRINREQSIEDQIQQDRFLSRRRRQVNDRIFVGLSRAFNTHPGSPRYEIKRTGQQRRTPTNIPPKETRDIKTYSWDKVTTMESGISIPYAYGTVSTKGNVIIGSLGGVPASYPDPNAQLLCAIIAVSKGPIDSFQSIKLNGETLATEITNNIHLPYMGYAAADYRLGYIIQPGHSPYKTACVNMGDEDTEVTYSTAVTYANVDMTNYMDAWLYLKFPNGLYSQPNGSSGDLAFETCYVRVEFKKSSDSTWTLAWEGPLQSNKRTVCRFYKQIIPVTWQYGLYANPYENTEYDFRVTKLTNDHTASENNAENTLYIEYLTVCNRKVFSYPGIAYVDLTAVSSSRFNGQMNFETVLKGRLVKIYSDVNTYTVAWSDNPAWVCLDVLTQPIWSNSYPTWNGYYWVFPSLTSANLSRHDGLNPSQIDIQSFIDWAAHCSGTVVAPAYDPTDTKRCTFNGVFEETTSLWDAAQSVAEHARAWLLPPSVGNAKYRVALDKTSAVTQVFTTGSIVKDSLSIIYTSMVDRASEIQATFKNKDLDYQEDTLNVIYPLADNIREDSMDLFGITVPSQAWRAAMLKLYYNVYVTCEVEFDAGQDAITTQVGDLIGVQSELPQWGFGGRVVSGGASNVVLDRPVDISDISAGSPYTLTIRSSDDTLTSYSITYTSNPATGSTYTLYASFDPVPVQYDPFAFGKTSIGQYKPFRVLGIEDNRDGTYHITGQEYNASIYGMDSDSPAVPTPNYTALNPFPDAENLVLDEILIKKQDGSLSDCIDVYFDKPSGSLFAQAEIYYHNKQNSGDDYPITWTYAGKTDLDKFRIMNVLINYYYEVAVVCVNNVGRKAPIDTSPTATVYTLGKADRPSNVTNFRVSQTGNIAVFSWTHIEDADLWGYEIRVGSDYQTSLEIIDIQSANRYDYPIPLNGTYRFWISAIDTSGNTSATPASVDITFIGVEDGFNFIIEQDAVTEYVPNGEILYNYVYDTDHFDYSVGTGSVNPPGYWQNFTNNQDFLAVFETDDIQVGAAPLSTTIRLSQVTTASMENVTDQTFPDRLDTDYPNDTDQHVSTTAAGYLYLAYGDSIPATGNFTLYTAPVQATCKYIRVRQVSVADNYDTILTLNNLRICADMQDIRFDINNYIITQATGAVIAYADYGYSLYSETPYIIASVTYGSGSSSSISKVPVISRVNSKFFQIELQDIVGAGATGGVNIQVHGY